MTATRDGQKLAALVSNADAGNPEQIEIWDLPREQLLHRLPELYAYGLPLLVGLSRKSTLARLLCPDHQFGAPDNAALRKWLVARRDKDKYRLMPCLYWPLATAL